MYASCYTSVKRWCVRDMTFSLLIVFLCFTDIYTASSVSARFNVSPKLKMGDSIVLVCDITEYQQLTLRVNCPLTPASGNCMEDCIPVCTNPSECSEEPRLRQISCTKSIGSGSVTFTYNINNVDQKFNGLWQCNFAGASSEALNLVVIEDPLIISLTANYPTIAESQSSVLTCAAKPIKGTLKFTWSRSDSASIPHSAITVNSTVNELRIMDSKRSDGATYICQVENEVGVKVIRSITLVVNFPPSSVLIQSSLPSPKTTGTPITFKCEVVGGQPTPSVLFYRTKFGKAREEISSSGTITLDRADNQANFYCKAVSVGITTGEMWSNAITFNVFYPPTGISISTIPSSPVKTGSKKEFTCITTSSSNPPSVVSWLAISPSGFQQTILDSNFRTTQTAGSDSGSQLESKLEIVADKTINKFQYRCTISYDGREIGNKQSVLDVIFPPEVNTINANPIEGVQESSDQSLICETSSAFPKPRIQWQKTTPGSTSPEDITFRATDSAKNGDYQGISVSSRIIISDTYRKDNNCVYSCVISQEGSTDSTVLKHTLHVFYPPDVVLTLNPTSPKEGDRVDINCIATGGNPDKTSAPFIYLWKLQRLDGSLLTLSNRNANYVIDKVGYDNIGEYQCIVENRGGKSLAKSTLNIMYAPTIDKSVATIISVAVNQQGVISLPVQANPNPSSIQWFKLNTGGVKVSLGASENINITQSASIYSLVINKVSNDNYGTYICQVANSMGSREFAINLVAPGPPDAPTNLHSVNVTAVSSVFAWRSELRGGSPQVFNLQWRLASASGWSEEDQVTGIHDPGFHETVYYTVLNFLSASQYIARVRAINQNKNGSHISPFSNLASFSTKTRPTIPSSSLGVTIRSGIAYVQFTPPTATTFSSVLLKMCETNTGICSSRVLLESEIGIGRASIVLPDPDKAYYFYLVIKDGDVSVFESQTFKQSSQVATAGLSFEIVLGISIGSAIAVAVLLAAVIVTAILQCRRSSELDKSIRSTNSSDVTNTSGSQRSPANNSDQIDTLQFPCRSSVTDGVFYGQSHSVTDLSPTSRLSHEFPPVMSNGGMPQHRVRLGTSNGSLTAQPDVVLSDSNTDLYRPMSRTSVSSSRSRSSMTFNNGGYYMPQANGNCYNMPNSNGVLHIQPGNVGYHHMPNGINHMSPNGHGIGNGHGYFHSQMQTQTPIPENYGVPSSPSGSANSKGILELRMKPGVTLGDFNPGAHMQPIYVATPLTPHMESNLETIENYV